MAKDTKIPAKTKYTVCAKEYVKEHPAVTTEGTVEDAIKAFQAAHGLDGLNLAWDIKDEGGAAVAAPVAPVLPPPPVVPISPVVAPTPAPTSPVTPS